MYQIISSAIVNRPPPKQFIQAAHFFPTKWYPINNTEEKLINFFHGTPGNGSKLFLQKLLPNRNWCYFEQCGEAISTVTTRPEKSFFELIWFRILLILYIIGLGWIFEWRNEEHRQHDIHETVAGHTYHQNIETDQGEGELNNLKIRLWLETLEEANKIPKFSNYDFFIPNLTK